MGADLEVRLGTSGYAAIAAQFLLGAAPGFLEGLHPQRFRSVKDAFRDTVKRGGSGIEPGGESLPPKIQERVDGVRRAAADSLSHLFDRRALAAAQQGIRGEFDITAGDAAGGRAIARWG
jgi:hypothetical protein